MLPLSDPRCVAPTVAGGRQLDVSSLDRTVHFYLQRGLTDSTRRTYRGGVNRYVSFCLAYNIINPFPVNESVLCYLLLH